MDYFSPSALTEILQNSPLALQSSTEVELLRLNYSSATNTVEAEIHNNFGDEIVSHIVVREDESLLTPRIDGSPLQGAQGSSITQILFLKSFRENGERILATRPWFVCLKNAGITTNKLHITSATFQTLCGRLNIPLAFVDAVLRPSIWSKQSGISYHRYDKEGEIISLGKTRSALKYPWLTGEDGLYHYFNEWDLGPLHVFFSYGIKSRITTYLLVDCPSKVRNTIVHTAQDPNSCFLHRPFAADFLITEQCALWRERFIDRHYYQIFDWHVTKGGMDPPLRPTVGTPSGLQSLHQLSRTWNMLYEDLTDLDERLSCLLDASFKLSSLPPSSLDKTCWEAEVQSATDALRHQRARNQLRRRWVTSFGIRTNLIINFVFSIAAQEDASTNLRIANVTGRIAEEARRDSSSMITIATMTMLFLPGTLVSAIFSMVFFDSGLDQDGNEVFSVSSRVWIFFAVAMPLTLIVMAVYGWWRRQREKAMKERRDKENADLERGLDEKGSR